MKITPEQAQKICDAYNEFQILDYQKGIETVVEYLDIDYSIKFEWGKRYLNIIYDSGDIQ